MIPSGSALVLIATMPIFSILATQWVGTNERVTPGNVAGIALELVFLSTVLGYVIFFRVLTRAGATKISLVTPLILVSAVFLGNAVLGEKLSSIQLVGMLFIGSGFLAIDGRAASAAWRLMKTRHAA